MLLIARLTTAAALLAAAAVIACSVANAQTTYQSSPVIVGQPQWGVTTTVDGGE